jgi:hypothetical protein
VGHQVGQWGVLLSAPHYLVHCPQREVLGEALVVDLLLRLKGLPQRTKTKQRDIKHKTKNTTNFVDTYVQWVGVLEGLRKTKQSNNIMITKSCNIQE